VDQNFKADPCVSTIPTTQPTNQSVENLRLWASAVLPFVPCTTTMGQDGGWHLIATGLAKKYTQFSDVTCEFVAIPGLKLPFGNPLKISLKLNSENLSALSIDRKPTSSLLILLFPTGNLQIAIDYPEYNLGDHSEDRTDASGLYLPISFIVGAIYRDIVEILTVARSQIGFIDTGRAIVFDELATGIAKYTTLSKCINSLTELCSQATTSTKEIAEAIVLDVFEVYPAGSLRELPDLYSKKAEKHNEYFLSISRPIYVGYHYAFCQTEEDSYLVAFGLSIYFVTYWIYDVLRELTLDVVNARLHQTSGRVISSAATVYLFFGTFAAQAAPVALTMNSRRTRFFSGAFGVWGVDNLLKGAAGFANQLREEVAFNASISDQRRGQFYSVAVAVITILTAIATISALERSSNTLTNVILSSFIIFLIYISAYVAFRLRGRRQRRTSVPITEALAQIRDEGNRLRDKFRARDLWG
jgi:hypothetical protein